MTPKEKAIEIISKYQNIEFLSTTLDEFGEKDIRNMGFKRAKQCALIAVDEIDRAIDFDWMEIQNLEREHNYWDQVKQEIEKL